MRDGYSMVGEYGDSEARNTFEERMRKLARDVEDLASSAEFIRETLFGCGGDGVGKQRDTSPSIMSSLSEIENHVADTARTLDVITESLTNSRRLRANG